MNKICYCFSVVSLLLSSSTAQDRDKSLIEIISVNFSATTIVSTRCSHFISQFPPSMLLYNEVVVEDSIALLECFLQKIELIQRHDPTVNTRAKLIFRKKQGEVTTICVGSFDIMVNGQLIKRNKIFTDFIFSMIPREHLGPLARDHL